MTPEPDAGCPPQLELGELTQTALRVASNRLWRWGAYSHETVLEIAMHVRLECLNGTCERTRRAVVRRTISRTKDHLRRVIRQQGAESDLARLSQPLKGRTGIDFQPADLLHCSCEIRNALYLDPGKVALTQVVAYWQAIYDGEPRAYLTVAERFKVGYKHMRNMVAKVRRSLSDPSTVCSCGPGCPWDRVRQEELGRRRRRKR